MRKRLPTALVAAALALPATTADAYLLRSDRVDGTHRDLVTDIAPVSWGLMTVRFTTPSQVLEVRDHSLELTPEEGHRHRGRFHIALQGQAHLIADLDLAGMPGRLEDDVTLPAQEVELDGVIDIERTAEGYLVTMVELPPDVELAIDSRLGGQLASLCKSLSLLGALACRGVDDAFSTLRLPLPEPGTTYTFDDADLTPEERRQLDEYLAGQ